MKAAVFTADRVLQPLILIIMPQSAARLLTQINKYLLAVMSRITHELFVHD